MSIYKSDKDMNTPNVSIIILNWNGWEDTIECLESLYQITYPNYFIIVVDNASEDDSIKKIKEWAEGKIPIESNFFKYNSEGKPIKYFEPTSDESDIFRDAENKIVDLPSNKKIIIIKNEKNYGYAEGNNVGMRYSLKVLDSDYVLILNNDTVVEKRFLTDLVNVAEGDIDIGIVGPKIHFYNEPDISQFKKHKKIDVPVEDHGISGCAFLVKSDLIKSVGLLDSYFFLYWEERDYFARAKKKGYKVMYAPTQGKVFHKVSASTNKVSDLQLYYMTRNKFLFIKKNATALEFALFIFKSFVRYTVRGINLLIVENNIKSFKCFSKGIYDGFLLLLKKG